MYVYIGEAVLIFCSKSISFIIHQHHIPHEHKKYPLHLLLISAVHANFCIKFYTTDTNNKYTIYHQVWWKYISKWQNYAVSTMTIPFFSVIVVELAERQWVHFTKNEWFQALQISTRSTIMSGALMAPCWKNTTNSSHIWKLPCRLVVGRYTEIPNRYPIFSNTDTDPPLLQTVWEQLSQNKLVANFTKSSTNRHLLTYLHVLRLRKWLWLPLAVTLNICSNSVRLQVCILMSLLTNRLFSEPPTDYQWRQCLAVLRNGGGGGGPGWHSIILSFSDIFLPNSMIQCMFIVYQMCKISCTNLHALVTSTKSQWGYFFVCIL